MADAYLNAAVSTAPPAALHGMLADAAVRHSGAAAAQLAAGDEAGGYAALEKASALVAELLGGVRPHAAPDEDARAVAEGVAARFQFCLERLADSGRTNAPAGAADAARVLTVHAETWRELLRGGDGVKGDVAAEPLAFAPAAAPAGEPVRRSWAA